MRATLVTLITALAAACIVACAAPTPPADCMTDTECGCTDDCLDPAE